MLRIPCIARVGLGCLYGYLSERCPNGWPAHRNNNRKITVG
jgi:hypothetical protein